MTPARRRSLVSLAALCLALAASGAAPALAQEEPSQFPEANSPENVGDPFRISVFGLDGDGSRAIEPEVATDPGSGISLVVYDNQSGAREVHGKLVAADGAPIGSDFDVTAFGESEEYEGQARDPDVAFSTAAGHFLVVFRGEAEEDVTEIWGQRVGLDGALIGEPLRISRTGNFLDGEVGFFAGDNGPPRVTYNATRGEWFAIWPHEAGRFTKTASSRGAPIPHNGVFGQRIDTSGARVLEDDALVAETDGTPGELDVAHDAANDRFLAVYATGRPDRAFGRSVAGDGTALGEPFVVSQQEGEESQGADPVVAWSPVTGEFLVAWEGPAVGLGDVNRGNLNDKVIHAQRYSGVPAPVGDPFEVSEQDPFREADRPDVAADLRAPQFVVTWEGEIGGSQQTRVLDEPRVALPRGEENEPWKEIHAQRIGGAGEELGEDFLVSQQRSEANPSFHAVRPAIAYNRATCRYLDVWEGTHLAATEEDDRGGGPRESEVFGRFIAAPPCPVETPTPTPTQAESQATPPTVAAQQASCTSRRRFRIRIREPRGKDRLLRAVVRVVDKRVAVRRRKRRLTAIVDLTGRAAGRFPVKITAWTAKGRRLKGTRRYRTCTIKLPGGIPEL